MADDSWDVQVTTEFHPYSLPHGMKDYILEDLTEDQLRKLSEFKRDKIREDQKYLSQHPEIRAIVSLILRLVMRGRPKCNIHEFIAKFFLKSSTDIREEIASYIKQREKIISANSTEEVPLETTSDRTLTTQETLTETLEDMSIHIIDNMEQKEGSDEDYEGEQEEDELIVIKGVVQKMAKEKDRTYEETDADFLMCKQILEEILDEIDELDSYSFLSFGAAPYYYFDDGDEETEGFFDESIITDSMAGNASEKQSL